VWDEGLTHGIVPKGMPAGMQVKDLGEILIQDASEGSNTGRMMAYVSSYKWFAGLTVQDWRYVVRIYNIDKSLLVNDASSGADLPDLMFQAMRKVPSLNMGRPVFYMARDTATWLARQKAAMGLATYATSATVAGDRKWAEDFNGIPIHRCDSLSSDEAAVT